MFFLRKLKIFEGKQKSFPWIFSSWAQFIFGQHYVSNIWGKSDSFFRVQETKAHRLFNNRRTEIEIGRFFFFMEPCVTSYIDQVAMESCRGMQHLGLLKTCLLHMWASDLCAVFWEASYVWEGKAQTMAGQAWA